MARAKQSEYFGIDTNNARDLDLALRHGTITLLAGPSGSGKSSVAIDTIYGVSKDELGQLMDLDESLYSYSIKSYENILPAICLNQENYNRNPRSTIATYFNIDLFIRELFSLATKRPPRYFSFNLSETMCRHCKGLGTRLQPDPLAFVDFSARVSDIPFETWRRAKVDLYRQLIELYCQDEGIDSSLRLKDLGERAQNRLISGQSKSKYKVRYKSNGRWHTKTTQYVGPEAQLEHELAQSDAPPKNRKFFSEHPCSYCGGSRFSEDVLSFTVDGKTIGELYLLSVRSLRPWIASREKSAKSSHERQLWSRIDGFLASLTGMNLDYLTLGRSIPSLSGGELQRLRLAKARNSQFSNFLYVLDEPTAGLHPSEFDRIASMITELKRRGNTVLVVDHSDVLSGIADRSVFLGPGGGSQGGRIVTRSTTSHGERTFEFHRTGKPVRIDGANFNNVKNLCVDLPTRTLVGVCGVSGSGKSSFLRGILPRYLDDAVYLRQTPIRGNAYSIVASYLGMLTAFQTLFARASGKSAVEFSFSTKGPGQCELCSGKGVLVDEFATPLECPDCGGKRFGERSLKHRIGGHNLYEILNLDIDGLVEVLPKEGNAIRGQLQLVSGMGLGYLRLFQDTATLSGGEAQRVKLAQTLLKSKARRSILLDEPFRGVDECNVRKIVGLLYSLVQSGNTIYLAEHNLIALNYCSYLIEFGPGAGDAGGRILFAGEREHVHRSAASAIGRYLSDIPHS